MEPSKRPPETDVSRIEWKLGARNNASDAKTIQAIHDQTVDLGAVCDLANAIPSDAAPAAKRVKRYTLKAQWSSGYITALPDSAFACVQGTQRFYPHHDSSGAVDLPHLRAALSRIGDPNNEQCGKAHLEAHAKAEGIGQ